MPRGIAKAGSTRCKISDMATPLGEAPGVDANVADLVRRAAAVAPGKAALLYRDSVLTWAELDARVERAAAALLARGLAPRDRVALLLGNGPDYSVGYFAILRAGLVAVPINPAFPDPELAHVLADSGARLVLGARSSDPDVPVLAVAELMDAPQGSVAAPAGGEDLAVLIYTSGTSGRPKGAMLSHRALLANLEQAARISPAVVSADDVVLLVLPLFHIYGLNAGLGAVAFSGATGVLIDRYDPVETLAEVRRRSVSVVLGAPPMFHAWLLLPGLAEAFSTVRLAVSGAAPLAPAVRAAVLEKTGHYVYEGYGLTETGPLLTTTLGGAVPKAGSIGQPIPGVQLRLVDDSRTEVEDEPGEIEVRGENLFSGYWPDGHGGPDGDGWLATGDVAYADDDGDLFLVDRRRELILVSGFNVYPHEVEQVLAGHPDIAEVAVIGISHPYTVESVKALVRPREGAHPTAEDVIAFAARSLARFKCPTTVQFVAELPHSATGTVAKGRLREAEAG